VELVRRGAVAAKKQTRQVTKTGRKRSKSERERERVNAIVVGLRFESDPAESGDSAAVPVKSTESKAKCEFNGFAVEEKLKDEEWRRGYCDRHRRTNRNRIHGRPEAADGEEGKQCPNSLSSSI
jgi:hypothetical protein